MPYESYPLSPVVYESADVVFPVGTILGDPATFTYRVRWSQVIPRTMTWYPSAILPTVTVDRSILVKHGHGEPNAWGVPCILSIVALQTPALCCVNVKSECYTYAYHLWWYARITDEEIRTIEWDELTREECDQLTTAVRQKPLRSLVGGRSSKGRRAPVIYRYPTQKEEAV